MQSHVLHPHIPQDDFFSIHVGVREGSVLSPILFLVAIDDMREYLAKHPFYKGGKAHRKSPSGLARSPGIWVGQTYLGLLQYVDDAVLLANSPEELQHMINVLAKYCHENRLTLNPKTGKTEVVEFLTPPSGYQYSVMAPTKDNPHIKANIGVVEVYPYLGWSLDKQLTLDAHTERTSQSIVAATARVGRMGGRPGGLPIRTTFHLWSSLALPYVYGAAALLSDKQVSVLQKKILVGVQQMAGTRTDPNAVLCDLGLPDVHVIRDIRLANLFARLQTLPPDIVPAALHRFLQTKTSARTESIEGDMFRLLARIGCGHLWGSVSPPSQALVSSAGLRKLDSEPDLIVRRRSELNRVIKQAAWNARRRALLETNSSVNPKLADYVQRFREDLLRKRLDQCAAYLDGNLSSAQQACMLVFRTGGSLIALHNPEIVANMEDVRCEGCRKHDPTSVDVCEDIPHALFRCVKGPTSLDRSVFMQAMEAVCASFDIRDEKGVPVRWSQLDEDTQSCLTLGGSVPPSWQFASYPPPREHRGREALRAELMDVAAPFLQAIARGLRGYRVAIIRDLAAGDQETWPRVRQLWNLGPLHEEVSESDMTEGDEMEMEEA